MSDTTYYGSMILLVLLSWAFLALLLPPPHPSEVSRCLCECVH
jgi:hypothetical protein